MENNNSDNVPEKFRDDSNDPGPFAGVPQGGYNGGQPPAREPEMSVKDWLITFLILMIPCVGLIMLIIWAVSNENKTRSNYAKAYLIFIAIIMVLSTILWVAFLGAMMSAFI